MLNIIKVGTAYGLAWTKIPIDLLRLSIPIQIIMVFLI